jgi:hypothetical protein
MSRRLQIYVLGGLLLLLVYVYVRNTSNVPGLPGVDVASQKFVPLNVEEPELRVDLLAQLKKLEYTGSHRNIFSAVAPPPAPTPAQIYAQTHQYPTVNRPPPEPPLVVPGSLFGYAAMSQSGKRLAFFLEGDDVLVVEEGGTFMNRFRLMKIGNDSAQVQEISTGKTATVAMVQPAEGGPSAMNQ